ncbi:hypothetical protein ACF061_31025 [Streptomyces sp. NPDC015220]|uniref:hypothetical protein n=1 Tax=Streptomyces sp. NPDC015220 TaxID=3364947 RepID=UPI0036F58649
MPAKSLPALIQWFLVGAQLGAERPHGSGKDADPLLVLTEAACERYGLPPALSESERLAGRLTEGHEVIKQLERSGWQLTERALELWARIYRPAQGAVEGACGCASLPRRALDGRPWGHAAQLQPSELARVLGVYAQRVMTPVGSTAVTGLRPTTALNPPTRAGEPALPWPRCGRPRRPG